MIAMKTDYENAKQLAISDGFENVDLCGQWHGFTVFSAVFSTSQKEAVAGCDELILVKNGKARWTKDDECDEIYDSGLFD
jgi:hypothetical protein